MICNECGKEIDDNLETCPNCGCPIENNEQKEKNNTVPKKKSGKIIVLSILCIVVFMAMVYIVPIKLSERNFIKAQEYEKIFEYEKAVSYYSKVVKWDKEDYKVALKKTDELNEKINAYKGAVSAIKAIKNQYGNEFEDVSKMYYTCYEGEYEYYIDCSYNKFKVTSNKDEEPEYIVPDMPAYTKVCYDNETNLTIVLYEPEYMSNGFLTGLANSIRNDTSDMLFNRTVLSAKEMNLEALQKYLG